MPVDFHATDDNLVTVKISGTLTKEDYKTFVPDMEKAIQDHGPICLLFQMTDFHGWELGAMWEDMKFGIKHFSDIERLAIVGEKKWEEWMAKVCIPFTKAKLKYFPCEQLAEAEQWLEAE